MLLLTSKCFYSLLKLLLLTSEHLLVFIHTAHCLKAIYNGSHDPRYTGCFFFNATIVNFFDNFYQYAILNVNKIKVINVLQLKTFA
jgi:hypothetical protein